MLKYTLHFYVEKAFDVDEKIIFVFSILGKNHKVYRYLTSISNQKPFLVVGISIGQEFGGKEFLDEHIHGDNSSFYIDNPRIFSFLEKYTNWKYKCNWYILRKMTRNYE